MTALADRDVLTVPEAAKIARVGRNQICAAVARGDLHAARGLADRIVRSLSTEPRRRCAGPFACPDGVSRPHPVRASGSVVVLTEGSSHRLAEASAGKGDATDLISHTA